jgi:hypothetical protein
MKEVPLDPALKRLCHHGRNAERCHVELGSASNNIKNLRDPGTK